MSSCWPTSRIFEDVANFDEGGIRSCVEHVDDAGRAMMAGALMNAVAIKALVQRVFIAGQRVAAVLQQTGQQLVTIVRNAVSQVVATVQSLVDALFAIFRSV
jgi:hypothetical protein